MMQCNTSMRMAMLKCVRGGKGEGGEWGGVGREKERKGEEKKRHVALGLCGGI